MAKTYFSGLGIVVSDTGVKTPDHHYALSELSPTRTLERRGNSYVVLNIVSSAGHVVEYFILEKKHELMALNAVNAINQALAEQAGAPLVSVPMPPAAERGACGWMLMIAGGIVVAVIILWLLFVIF